jgi:hypothetical protein
MRQPLSIRKKLALAAYMLFLPPKAVFVLLWLHLTDRDTPRKRRWIQAIATELRGSLSPDTRIIEGYFERRLFSRDLARVPKIL